MSTDPVKRPFYTVIPLLFSQTVGAFNDNAMKAILPVMAAYQFGKASMDEVNQQVSIVLILPFVIFAPLAGWVSDRFSKKKVVSMTLLAQLLGLGLLSYGLVRKDLLLSLIGFFLLSTQSAFLSPAKKGILKEMIGSGRLAMAVGWMEMLAMVGILGGAFAGAMCFDALVEENGGWKAALILALATMALAFISWLAFLPTPSTEAPKAQPFKAGVLWSHFGDLRDLLGDRALRGPALGDAWFWSVGGFFYLVLVKLSGEVVVGKVGMGALYGFWFLLLGLGIMAGSIFVAYLNRGRIELGLTAIGGLIMPASLILLYFSDPGGGFFTIGCLALGFSGALFFVPLNGFLQDQAEEDRRGRVLAAANLLTQLSGILFILFHAFLSSYLGLSAKQELLVILVPSLLVGFFTLRALLEDFFRAWFHIFLRIFYRIRAIGMENLPAKEGALIVSNHLSYADPVFIGAACPRKVRYLAFEGLSRSAALRFVFRLTDTLTVSPEKSLGSLRRSSVRLKEGMALCMFAEGGISRLGTTLPFMRGPGLLARKAKVPLFPLHLDGVWGSVFSSERGKFFWKRPLRFPYPVTVRMGEPMDPAEGDAEDLRRRVLELGRLSFSERMPHAAVARSRVLSLARKAGRAPLIEWTDGSTLTRREFWDCVEGRGGKVPPEIASWVEHARVVLEGDERIAERAYASFTRAKETNLWHQEGFAVGEGRGPWEDSWFPWIPLLGQRVAFFGGKKILVVKLGSSCRDPFTVDGLASELNGLVSMNLPPLGGDSNLFSSSTADDVEKGSKRGSLGRLLCGFSYYHSPADGFSIKGIRDEPELIRETGGLDEEGFLLPS